MNILPWFIDSFERIHMNPHILRYFNKTLFVTGFLYFENAMSMFGIVFFSHLVFKEMADIIHR